MLLSLGLLPARHAKHILKQTIARIIKGLTLSHGACIEIDPALLLLVESQRAVFVEIFTVGAGAPNGVPRPVVNRIM